MKFGIFLANAGRRAGGPETYELQLVRAIAEVDRDSEYIIYCPTREAERALTLHADNMRIHVLRPSSRWISLPFSLPVSLARHGVDGFHSTFVAPPWSSKPQVFTMHDVTPFVHPEYYPPAIGLRLRALIRAGIRGADLILCISEHALRTTQDLFDISDQRLAVVHHGVNPEFKPVAEAGYLEQTLGDYGIHSGYFLHVGKLEPRKNTVRLLEAFHLFRQTVRDDVKLVLAGRRTWRLDEIDAAIDRMDLRSSIIELGYVKYQDLPALYSGALAFVFPTLWEGFGFPVLEAMACGTPVVASSVTSIPEIAGDAALLVDPMQTGEIAEAMVRVFQEPGLRERLRGKGLERVRRFTWRKTAEKTIALYHRVAGL